MRFLPLLIGALFLTGCGSAMSERQAAAELDTARIAVFWGAEAVDEPIAGVFDLRTGNGTIEQTILTTAAVYEPIPTPIANAPEKRWVSYPREPWDPFWLAPIADHPAELLAFLGSADRGEAVGEGEERGEPVTYYAATIDMEAFIAAQPPGRRLELEEVYAEWEGRTFQLAVDAEGRFRRAEFPLAEREIVIFEIFDYGVPVDVRAPDPSTVLTSAEYEKLLQAECARAKREGREDEVPHCASCGAGEAESGSEV